MLYVFLCLLYFFFCIDDCDIFMFLCCFVCCVVKCDCEFWLKRYGYIWFYKFKCGVFLDFSESVCVGEDGIIIVGKNCVFFFFVLCE